MFGLDQDFKTFYKTASKEPKLSSAQKLARGRVLRSPTFFEDVLKTILTTNTLWAATKRMNLNLIATYGDPLSGSEFRTFPSPARIAASNFEPPVMSAVKANTKSARTGCGTPSRRRF